MTYHNLMSMRMELMSPVLGTANSDLETKPEIIKDEFTYLFIECVEQTLTDLVGARVRDGLLDYIARHARLAKADLAERPCELSILLERSFGKAGTVIEKRILRRLYTALGSMYRETPDFNFAIQVEEARTRYKAGALHSYPFP